MGSEISVDGLPGPGAGRATVTRRKALWSLVVALSPAHVFAQDAAAQLRAPNIVAISPNLVTSGQPTSESLAQLKTLGFGAVISLAPLSVPDAVRDEPNILERQGIAFVHIPIASDDPTESDFQDFASALRGFGGRKVLVHCQVNMRASSMVFLYRVIVAKESPEIAYESVTQVWSPEGSWKRLLVSELRKSGSSFEPY